ncbi:MAG: hypothetical protein GOMPHAMPRED_007256 [Gomphillus americanus]|uniref:Uncharacterized protein n=1 Tax=Gomphillus americanus TaxID=1940652 RepID=A0A8H3EV93_9LECA|nr:MAG: hypothetical protein GOMPHAMPRED_007256 [Gomphillus americanus]
MESPRAAARLRKAFRYPDDIQDSQEPEAIDEEEQERLIRQLQKQNDQSNEFWLVRLLDFLAAYYWQVRLACIFAMSSFGMTAYVLLFIPSGGPKMALFPRTDLSPAQKFVPYMNGVLSLLIGLNGLSWKDRLSAPDGFWIVSWMPLVILATVIVARKVLVEVNPDELWDLKYELRGA